MLKGFSVRRGILSPCLLPLICEGSLLQGYEYSIQELNINTTRQVSSMIHSASPIVTPVANIVFRCFVFLDLKSGDGLTYEQTNWRTTCAKTMITIGRDFGLAEWNNKYCIELYYVSLLGQIQSNANGSKLCYILLTFVIASCLTWVSWVFDLVRGLY